MALWLYEARDARGQLISGTHQAPSRQEALEFLRAQGLFLTRLDAPKGATDPTISPFNSGAKPQLAANKTTAFSVQSVLTEQPLVVASKRDISLFFRQMSSATHAGVSLGMALSTVATRGEAAALRRVAAQLGPRVQGGEPISAGMKAFPGLFSPLMVGVVQAGERGGTLDTAFARLADYAERDYALETTLKRETWYPKLLALAAIFIPAVVPLVLEGVGAALKQVAVPLFSMGVLWLVWRVFKLAGSQALRKSGLVYHFDALKLGLPLVGKVTRSLASAKMCRALGALYSAGVPPVETLQLSAMACGNELLKRRALAQLPLLMNGAPFSELLARIGAFHPMALQMLQVGEQTGDIDGQLEKAAIFLEADAETAIKQAIPALGILVFLGIAAYIGFLVVTSWSSSSAFYDDLMKQ